MFRKIGFKLILVVGVTALVIIGIFSYYNIRSHTNALLDEVERHANQLSETVKHSVRYDMLLNHRERVHTIINTIGDQPGIQNVRVMNKEGQIIYASREEEINHMVDKKAESCYACHAANEPIKRLPIKDRTRIYTLMDENDEEDHRVLGIITPIYNERSCYEAACHAHDEAQSILGVLDVTIPLNEVDNQIRQGEIDTAVFAVSAILVFSLLLWYFVKKWVDKPVKELVNATHEIGTGNLNYIIKETGNDEFGILERSFNNMTQKLQEARTQLFQSDKMASLGRLAAGVAHEINNPLTGVLTYSSFLLKKTKDNPELNNDLKVIVRETIRSREIVKSLLDFSRQSITKKNMVNINDIIDKSISVLENQLTINKVVLQVNLNNELPATKMDANQMQQVMINLLVNASDAISPDGGKIYISTDLIKLSPHGITHIKNAICPKRHSLMDSDNKIEGLPSIKLKVNQNGRSGLINIDPIYGRHHDIINMNINNKDLKITCPVCETSLINPEKKCPDCNVPVYEFEVPSRGFIQGCISENCSWQKWDDVDSGGLKDYIEIKIKDTGCGIRKEALPKIFEPFYSTKGQKGTGLGLSVTWGIIDNHNGTIRVESEVNKGTTFIIHLPISQRER